jgi:nucleotide-binding universal stress UspA family protein
MTNVAETKPLPRIYRSPDARVTAINHVLVCLDRSEASDGCLPYARFAAEAFGAATTTLFHVMSPSVGMHQPDRADPLQRAIEKREVALFLSNARTSLGVSPERILTCSAQGRPAEQIVVAAGELGADLTILSRHGEGGGCTPDLGSTVQHVLASSAGSILLTAPQSSARVPPNRILVPLDGSLRSECVLPIAADLARLHGAEVLLVHVVTKPTQTAVLSSPDDMRLVSSLASRVQTNAEAYLARIRARLLPDVRAVSTLVIRGTEERQALLDVAVQQAADMLVLTAHGSTCNLGRAFGSVASYLLAHARLPIFVFQDVSRDPIRQA